MVGRHEFAVANRDSLRELELNISEEQVLVLLIVDVDHVILILVYNGRRLRAYDLGRVGDFFLVFRVLDVERESLDVIVVFNDFVDIGLLAFPFGSV